MYYTSIVIQSEHWSKRTPVPDAGRQYWHGQKFLFFETALPEPSGLTSNETSVFFMDQGTAVQLWPKLTRPQLRL